MRSILTASPKAKTVNFRMQNSNWFLEEMTVSYYLTLLVVTCLLCRLSAGYPFSGEDKHFDKVTVDIKDVTNTTALMEWVVPHDQGQVDSYTVSCTTSESQPLEFPASNEAKQMALTDLIPNTDYSCSLLANDKTRWKNILDPIHFTTLNTTKGSVAKSSVTTKNRTLLLLSILLPIFLLTVCIGGCVLTILEVKKKKIDENKKPMSYKSVSYRGQGSNPDTPKKDYKKLWQDMRTKYKRPELQTPSNTKSNNQVLFDNSPEPNSHQNPVLQDNEAEAEILISPLMPLTLLDLSTSLLPMQTQLIEDYSKLDHNMTLDNVQLPFPPPSEDDIIV